MTQLNNVTIEEIPSKSKLYNKPIAVVKYTASIIDNIPARATIINGASSQVSGSNYMQDRLKGKPLSRILELEETVEDLKKGKVEFRTDKAGNLHVPVGKKSFENQKLFDNIISLIDTVNRLKPATSKGHYLKNIVLTSTMGPGIKVEVGSLKAN